MKSTTSIASELRGLNQTELARSFIGDRIVFLESITRVSIRSGRKEGRGKEDYQVGFQLVIRSEREKHTKSFIASLEASNRRVIKGILFEVKTFTVERTSFGNTYFKILLHPKCRCQEKSRQSGPSS